MNKIVLIISTTFLLSFYSNVSHLAAEPIYTVFAASMQEPEKENKDPLTFKGCSIIRRAFMSEAAVAYEKITGQKINVMGGGATLGIRAAAAGDADIGGSCRPCLPNLFDEEKGVYMTHIAWDSIAVITHPSNTIDSITIPQAKSIMLGNITNWKEVGGLDRPIVPAFTSQVPEHGGKYSGTVYMFRRIIFNDPDISFTKKGLFFRHAAELEEVIEKINYTFAITGISSALKRNVKTLKLNGVEPSKENRASGKYPIFRPLYLMTKGKPTGDVKEFIDWLLGEEGQNVVSGQGTVNLIEGKALIEKFKFWEHTNLITNHGEIQ